MPRGITSDGKHSRFDYDGVPIQLRNHSEYTESSPRRGSTTGFDPRCQVFITTANRWRARVDYFSLLTNTILLVSLKGHSATRSPGHRFYNLSIKKKRSETAKRITYEHYDDDDEKLKKNRREKYF